MRSAARAACFIALLCGLSPVAHGAEGRCDRDFVREYQAFDQKYVIEAYTAAGSRDPKWNDNALALLKAQCAAMASDVASNFVTVEVQPLAERATLAQKVVESGCDDPLVLYAAGQVLLAAGERDAANDALRRADAGADMSPYCEVYKILMLDAYQSVRRRDDVNEELDAIRERFRPMLKEALRATDMKQYRAVIWSKLGRFLDGSNHEMLIRLADETADMEGADPWLHEMLQGNGCIKRGWKARGGGWASTVTEEGWATLREEMMKAEDHFNRAIAADDSLPHPHAMLIAVGMGSSDDQLTKRGFKGAIQRQIDFYGAYDSYIYSLTPRWGGSYEAMFEVGANALATGRFDTGAPSMVLKTIASIENEQGEPLTRAQRSAFTSHIEAMAKGYEEKNPEAWVKQWARSVLIAQAYRFRNWSEARAILDRANGTVSNNALTAVNLDPTYVLGEISSRTGSQAERVEAALKINDPATREQELGAILNDVPKEEKGRHWIVAQARTAKIAAEMARGQWVDLPLNNLEDDWRILRGNWQVEPDGSLVGDSTAGLDIVSRFELPKRFEMRVEAECLRPDVSGRRFFIFYPNWSPKRAIKAWTDLDKSQMYISFDRYSYAKGPMVVDGDQMTLVAQYDTGTVWLDDEASKPISYTFGIENELPVRIGFGAADRGDAGKWRIRKVQVRKY